MGLASPQETGSVTAHRDEALVRPHMTIGEAVNYLLKVSKWGYDKQQWDLSCRDETRARSWVEYWQTRHLDQ